MSRAAFAAFLVHQAVLVALVLPLMIAASLLASPLAASAQSCDPGTEQRLQYLETRLEEGESNAKLWWRGWLAGMTR